MTNADKTHEYQGDRLLRHLAFLRGKRIFTIPDAKEAALLENIPFKQLNKILSNLTKQKQAIRLRRGVYISTGLLGPDIHAIHPFVISAYLIQPSVISHWSALHHHGLTEQIPLNVTASTTKKFITPSMRETVTNSNHQQKHAWEIEGIRYEYIHTQKEHYFGHEIIWLNEHFQVSITDKERTLLDLFVTPKLFGGFGESLGILESALPTIDLTKLIMYAIKYDQKSTVKRLGWALEQFGVPVKKLAPLLNIPISYYCPLDPSGPATGPCDNRWMIQNNLISVKN